MAGGKWRESRTGMVVAGLALLAAAPAVTAAAGVRDRWVLAGATAVAAVVVAVGAVWQDRYRQVAQRRDEVGLRTEDGCLVLPDGRMPAVRDITDPVRLGVHRAAPAAVPAEVPGGRDGAAEHVPAYVPRDVDGRLRELLAAGGFVLLVGDSTAGKTRAAFEAMAATLPRHVLVCPSSREAVSVAVTQAAQARRCVLWLDDLERFLGSGGLTAAQLGRLIIGGGHRRVILATLRAVEEARLADAAADADDGVRDALRDTRRVLDQATTIRMARMFSPEELDRARARDWDPRVAEALGHSREYGIAEYLAAGPELLQDWEDARGAAAGRHARGAALVAAAIDLRRAGHTGPIPRVVLGHVQEQYLAGPEHRHTPREPLPEAWQWATRQRVTTALLQPVASDRVEVFDYLVDTVQRRTAPGAHVPELVIRAAVDASGPGEATSLGDAARAQRRYALAEYAYRHAYSARCADPELSAEHPDTLTSRSNLALALWDLGRHEDAAAEHRAILDTRTRVLGVEHPDTMASRSNLALALWNLGRLEDAEAEHRAALETRTRILGAEHPDTLTSQNNLGVVLRDLGRLEEAEAEHRAVLDTRTRILGAEHPDTLTSRNNLDLVLRDLGRPAQTDSGLS
jgi:tetratricopeptide (TPR) repeat protein